MEKHGKLGGKRKREHMLRTMEEKRNIETSKQVDNERGLRSKVYRPYKVEKTT